MFLREDMGAALRMVLLRCSEVLNECSSVEDRKAAMLYLQTISCMLPSRQRDRAAS